MTLNLVSFQVKLTNQ